MAEGTVGVTQSPTPDRLVENETHQNTAGETVYRQVTAIRNADLDQRYDWQQVGTDNRPLYIGTALPATASSAPRWRIEKYTYGAGPVVGTYVVTLIETRTGSWDDRATLF